MVSIVSGEKISSLVSGLVHEPKQTKEWSLDLTVREVFEFSGCGSLDFGGSEYKEAFRKKKKPSKKNPGDKHGWWTLTGGVYLITLNETIQPLSGFGFICPHTRLVKCGCTHPTLLMREWSKDFVLPLTVGVSGVEIKENARVSKLFVLE